MQMIDNVSPDLLYDHTSLYLRPQTKGRGNFVLLCVVIVLVLFSCNCSIFCFSGIAVLSMILLDSCGQYQPFKPGVVTPSNQTRASDESYKHILTDQPKPSLEKVDDTSLCIYIWEKGNIGFADLQSLLIKCFSHSITDCLLELFLLPSPVANVLEDEDNDIEESTSMLEDTFVDDTLTTQGIAAITPTSHPVRSRHDTMSIIQGVEEAIGTPPDYNVAVEGQITGLQVRPVLQVLSSYLLLIGNEA